MIVPERTIDEMNPNVILEKESEGENENDKEVETKKEKVMKPLEEEMSQPLWKPERERNSENKKFYRTKNFRRSTNNNNNTTNNNNNNYMFMDYVNDAKLDPSFYKNNHHYPGGTNIQRGKDKMNMEEITRICEWKEMSQLGNNRKKIILQFNETYGVNMPSITHSLSHIFKLNPNEDIIIFLLQKYLHATGLCVPCYKFGNKRTKCFSHINCKWCHHPSHLNKDSFWNPMKYLHLKKNCRICNSFMNGESCSRNRDCQYCHSIEHLSDNVKVKYFNILTTVQKNKKYEDIITDEIVQAFDVTKTTDRKKEPSSDIESITSLLIQVEKDEEKKNIKKEEKDLCNECVEHHKKPCINYFLHRKNETFENCTKLENCYNCHNDIHMNVNSSVFILNYLHQQNLCFVCPQINEDSCNCSTENSIYCHEEVHISFDKIAKRLLHKTIQEIQQEFIDTEKREQEKQKKNEQTEIVDSSKAPEFRTDSMNNFSNMGSKELEMSYQNKEVTTDNRKRTLDINYYPNERSNKKMKRRSTDITRNNHRDQKRERGFVKDTNNNVGSTEPDTFINTTMWKNNSDRYFKHKNNREKTKNRKHPTLYKNKSFIGRNYKKENRKENEWNKEENNEINKNDSIFDIHQDNKEEKNKEDTENYKTEKEFQKMHMNITNEMYTNPTMQYK